MNQRTNELIIPAILKNSTEAVQGKIERVKGLVKRVQVDVIDGIFADNLTVSPIDLLDVEFSDLAIDIHLMTEEPETFISESALLKERGVSVRIIGHLERMGKQEEFVQQVRQVNCQLGLALDLFTPLPSLKTRLYQELDCILLMSVKAGFAGQKFQKSVLEKITQLSQLNQGFSIVVDGGLNPENIKLCRQAGANEFAVGSWLWRQKDVKAALKQLNASTEI